MQKLLNVEGIVPFYCSMLLCVYTVYQYTTGQGTVDPVKALKACKVDQRYSSTHSTSQHCVREAA